MKSVHIPNSFLYDYLQAGGLSERMAVLAGGGLGAPKSLEGALDQSLALGLLLAATPLPDSLQDKLLRSLDGLGSSVVIKARGPGCGPSGMKLGEACTRAEALDLVRAGWARAWSPGALLEGQLPFSSAARHTDALPAIEVLAAEVLAADDPDLTQGTEAVQQVEYLPDGSGVPLDPDSLEAALDKAEDSLERDLPGSAPLVENLSNWTRYAFGKAYNNWNLPDNAFAFMDLFLPACHRLATTPQDPQDTGLAAGLPKGYPNELVALWQLTLRATQLQLALPPAPELGYRPASGGIIPQQLTGLAAAPGRISGRTARSYGSGGVVIICEQLSMPLAMAEPAAVLERRGSRLGLGALLARDAGFPCISGIGDLATLPDKLPVMVDGHLGLVTIDRSIGRQGAQ